MKAETSMKIRWTQCAGRKIWKLRFFTIHGHLYDTVRSYFGWRHKHRTLTVKRTITFELYACNDCDNIYEWWRFYSPNGRLNRSAGCLYWTTVSLIGIVLIEKNLYLQSTTELQWFSMYPVISPTVQSAISAATCRFRLFFKTHGSFRYTVAGLLQIYEKKPNSCSYHCSVPPATSLRKNLSVERTCCLPLGAWAQAVRQSSDLSF
jgi:hypothetical protein